MFNDIDYRFEIFYLGITILWSKFYKTSLVHITVYFFLLSLIGKKWVKINTKI